MATSLTDHVKSEVLQRDKEGRNNLHILKRRKDNWVGHMLRGNWILKHVIEKKIKRSED